MRHQSAHSHAHMPSGFLLYKSQTKDSEIADHRKEHGACRLNKSKCCSVRYFIMRDIARRQLHIDAVPLHR